MINLDILLAFEEETLEVLGELEEATSPKDALTCLNTIYRSSKLVDLSRLKEITIQLSNSIEASNNLNVFDIQSFNLEARSLIRSTVQRAELEPEPNPKSSWWKFW